MPLRVHSPTPFQGGRSSYTVTLWPSTSYTVRSSSACSGGEHLRQSSPTVRWMRFRSSSLNATAAPPSSVPNAPRIPRERRESG